VKQPGQHAESPRLVILAAVGRGARIRDFIEARLTLVTTGFAALIVLGFLSIRYL
jgi:hypothetical protein